jgi:hypothetical protein
VHCFSPTGERNMRKLNVSTLVTLDGVIQDPGGFQELDEGDGSWEAARRGEPNANVTVVSTREGGCRPTTSASRGRGQRSDTLPGSRRRRRDRSCWQGRARGRVQRVQVRGVDGRRRPAAWSDHLCGPPAAEITLTREQLARIGGGASSRRRCRRSVPARADGHDRLVDARRGRCRPVTPAAQTSTAMPPARGSVDL